jgi:DNA-binding NarL/FixJ family response regulator
VEDNLGDIEQIREIFKTYRKPEFTLLCESTLRNALKIIPTGGIDAVLLDPALSDSRGKETLAHISTFTASVPLLILSGYNDSEMAEEAIRLGAQDYLLKDEVLQRDFIPRALRNSVLRQHFWQSRLAGKY